MVEFYRPGTSWIHRADPRVKLAFTVACALALLAIRQLWLTAAIGVALLALYAWAGLPGDSAMRVVRAMAPVSLLMGLLRALFYPAGELLVAWGPLQFTTLGLADGATLGLRLLSMALAVFLWLYATESRAIVQGFVQLGLPYSWGLSLSMALRYIPSIGRDYRIISQSQQARGLDLRAKRGLARVRALLPGLLALIVSSFRASENMARALEARAYGAPGVRRTTITELQLRPSDWLYLTAIVVAVAALIYLRLRYGFGAAPLSWLG